MCENDGSLQHPFLNKDILFSGDTHSDIAWNHDEIVMFLRCPVFWGEAPKFLTQFYKSGSQSNIWQTLVMIVRASLKQPPRLGGYKMKERNKRKAIKNKHQQQNRIAKNYK